MNDIKSKISSSVFFDASDQYLAKMSDEQYAGFCKIVKDKLLTVLDLSEENLDGLSRERFKLLAEAIAINTKLSLIKLSCDKDFDTLKRFMDKNENTPEMTIPPKPSFNPTPSRESICLSRRDVAAARLLETLKQELTNEKWDSMGIGLLEKKSPAGILEMRKVLLNKKATSVELLVELLKIAESKENSLSVTRNQQVSAFYKRVINNIYKLEKESGVSQERQQSPMQAKHPFQ